MASKTISKLPTKITNPPLVTKAGRRELGDTRPLTRLPPRQVGDRRLATPGAIVQAELQPLEDLWRARAVSRAGIYPYQQAVFDLRLRWKNAGIIRKNIKLILRCCKKPNRPRKPETWTPDFSFRVIIWASAELPPKDRGRQRSKLAKLLGYMLECGEDNVEQFVKSNGGDINSALASRSDIRPHRKKKKKSRRKRRL